MVVAMNIHKRFIIQFFIQLSLVSILFFFILLSIWAIIGYSTMNDTVTHDLSQADSYFLSDKITLKDKKVKFDDDLKRLVTNQNGWLLVLNTKGDVMGSYHAPKEIPAHIKESELADLMLNHNSNHVEYTHWKLDETYPQPLLLFFGREIPETMILNEIKPNIDWKNHRLNLSASSLHKINAENGWIQLIHSTGKVIDQYGTDQKPVTYSAQDFLTLSNEENHSVASFLDAETKQMVMVGINHSRETFNLEEGLFQTISNRILVVFVLLLLLLLIGTFWYARKFGVPLLTLMKWIQNLGSGIYEQPLDLHQQSMMLNKKGKLKRKYRLYKDLIATLSQLTETLKSNEAQRKKITQTREEWISGLSHDLKTPLASITGYAQMLESKDYSWTEAETKEFAGIITEKSTYMKELLEDLTLSYQLKNQALPIAKEQMDINEFIRRTIIHFVNAPTGDEKEFIFHPSTEPAFVFIDPKWFQRIMDNLIANAVKYNPPGTTITVTITPIEDHLMIITIEDDGIGMDNETLGKLFHRYYRGTNTSESSSGTGLGMAITKQLVQLHEGSINVKSAPQKGTTVRIILPNGGLTSET